MNRQTLIKFIPKPSNNDVIIYDITLKDLVDVDVFKEYMELLPVFNISYQHFLEYENNLKEYQKKINEIYLFKPNWSEEDYLFHLQNEKKTYSNLYGPIKKIESNISLLQKKVKMINDKIEMQNAKEANDIEDKKKNIDKRINENVDKLIDLKEKYTTLNTEANKIKELLKENEEEFSELQLITDGIKKGECKCKYCGSKLSNVSPNSLFYKRTVKNLEKNKKELEELLQKQSINAEALKEVEENIKEIKQTLNNDSKFKSQDFNFYQKKSVEILKLEGKRDYMLNDIAAWEKELEKNSQSKTSHFLDLKNKIEQYEISLENLQKIKELKKQMQPQKEEYLKLKTEITAMKTKMDQYKQFISIYFKIYEQKAAEYCGKGFRFKIFDFEDYSLIEKFELYYNEVEYNHLNSKTRIRVDDFLKEKFYFCE